MKQTGTTPVPNTFFDYHLAELKSSELKILLVIIRQTLGWKDRNGKNGRKENDWISGTQLSRKTGCSRRAITTAIEELSKKKYINIQDETGNLLNTPDLRKGKAILIYSLNRTMYYPVENHLGKTEPFAIITEDIRKRCTDLAQKMHITKET